MISRLISRSSSSNSSIIGTRGSSAYFTQRASQGASASRLLSASGVSGRRACWTMVAGGPLAVLPAGACRSTPGHPQEPENARLMATPYVVVEAQFVKPGKGQAFTRCRLKNLVYGQRHRAHLQVR